MLCEKQVALSGKQWCAIGKSIPFILSCMIVGSCSTKPSGTILLDHGEVFTRERLVNERLNNLNWLQNQLNNNTPTGSTLQGARFRSQFTGFAGQLSAQFDPLGTAAATTGLQTMQSGAQVVQLQNQIQSAALQQELQALENGTLSYTNIVSPVGASSSNSPAGLSYTAPGLTNIAPVVNIVNAMSNATAPSNLIQTPANIQLTPVEQFQDQLAYRDAVSSEIHEQELDDTHDRDGMTLYTLAFHLSVAPGSHNKYFGRVRASFEQDASQTPSYNQWLAAFRKTFDHEVISIQRRYLQNFLTDDEIRELILDCWKYQDKVKNRLKSKTQKLEELEKDSKTNSSKIDDLKAETNDLKIETNDITQIGKYFWPIRSHMDSDLTTDTNAMRALCWVVKEQFESLNEMGFGRLIRIRAPEPVSDGNKDFMYLMRVEDELESNGAAVFEQARKSVEVKVASRTFVYAIEPKEFAQNLQDQSDKQSSLSLALGLSAAIPQISTSLGLYLQYLQQNEYMLETIKRRPLLTAFMDGSTNFGWLVGGRFKIDKNYGLTYEQVPVQEAVQVTLEVPSWWSAVKISASKQWLKKDGNPFCAGDITLNTVQLKPDYDGLTRAFLEEANSDLIQPQIYPTWDPNQNTRGYIVQVGLPAQLLILGRNLWRNPKVFIGSQSTSDTYNYDVLPDMGGIVANFSQVANVLTLSTNPTQPVAVDLRVVTSDGEAVLRDGVTVISSSLPGPMQGFVNMSNFYGIAGSTISFAVNTNASPSAFASYQLALSPANAKPQEVSQTNLINNGILTFQIPAAGASNNLWTAATAARIDVWMQPTVSSEPSSVLIGGEQSFVIFTNVAQSQFLFVTNMLSFSTTNFLPASGAIAVGLPAGTDPNLFWNARPGLVSQLQGGTLGQLQIQLASTNGTISTNIVPVGPVIFNAGAGSFQFNLAQSSIAAITNVFNLQNSCQTNCTGVILIPATNPKWTIPVSGNLTLSRKD